MLKEQEKAKMSFLIKPKISAIIPKKGHDPALIGLYTNASKIDLKHVKQVLIDFDPFHERTNSIRFAVFCFFCCFNQTC